LRAFEAVAATVDGVGTVGAGGDHDDVKDDEGAAIAGATARGATGLSLHGSYFGVEEPEPSLSRLPLRAVVAASHSSSCFISSITSIKPLI
jgi:DhnA family fructose-bisphosphate aldolase class Ia